MRIDMYTKAILTLIACALLVIAGNTLTKPTRSVAAAESDNIEAQIGGLTGVQFSYAANGGLLAVDTRTGDIWLYGLGGELGYSVGHLGRIDELGKPLIVTANR